MKYLKFSEQPQDLSMWPSHSDSVNSFHGVKSCVNNILNHNYVRICQFSYCENY